MNLDWPTLETERLILRPWKPEDFEPYARFSADEESMRYLGRDGRPTDAAETWRTICLFIGHWYLRGYTLWAVEERGPNGADDADAATPSMLSGSTPHQPSAVQAARLSRARRGDTCPSSP